MSDWVIAAAIVGTATPIGAGVLAIVYRIGRTVERMHGSLERVADHLEDHETRLRALERRKGKGNVQGL